MIQMQFNDMSIYQPEPYQIILATDGRYFSSGIWVETNEKCGIFVSDFQCGFNCTYWIPLPTGLDIGLHNDY